MLVLAAGASRRLGRPKQFVRIAGTALITRAIATALALRPGWLGVVTGAQASRIAAQLKGLPVHLVRARDWRAGMGASLRAGVRRVPRQASRILVMTVDQWAIGPRDLARLLRTPARHAAGAGYRDIIGVPAVFPAGLRPLLLRLGGDAGARALLAAPGVTRVPMPDAALDLDRPGDRPRSLRAARPEAPWRRLTARGPARLPS